MVNEARVNRKIADLELSIKSLLTVNAMLEATVRKQASQLGQMKKEISSNGITHTPIIEEPEAQEIEDNSGDEHWDDDILFQKLKKLTEQMIDEGQKSIDFEYKILGRVLSLDDDEEEEGDTMSDIKDLSIQSNSSIDSNSQSPLQEEKNKSPGPTPSFNHKPRKLRPAAKRGKST
ncbi:hypothetical protein BDB01DRAFT_783028 [Pilobolus umbonatus]|nr:hypothetical protein BDB01DRAFT_783028 [Pilobolus umbonatus]